MNFKKTTLAMMAAASLFTFASVAQAQVPDDASFSGMWKMDYIDSNKDGMVSKTEFLAMMGKAWDMKAKEMKVKGDKMTMDELMHIQRGLSRGEKNK
jgi:hypothetical protein